MSPLDLSSRAATAPRRLHFRSVISMALLLRLVLCSLFWGLLARWDPSSLGVGIVFIVIASLLSLYLKQQPQPPQKSKQWLPKPLSFLSFLCYFAVQSLRGGWDIAKLALTPNPKLSPGFITYHIDLATESQVFTFMQVLGLLPGTVSAKLNGRALTIHVMNMNTFNIAEIDDCQTMIKKLAGVQVNSLVDEGKL